MKTHVITNSRRLPEIMRTATGLEDRRIKWYAYMLRHGKITPEFVLHALADPAWPQDSRADSRRYV